MSILHHESSSVCALIAATLQVGEMMLPIMGTAPGYTIEDARPPAIALGIALQLTNILRDVRRSVASGECCAYTVNDLIFSVDDILRNDLTRGSKLACLD